MTGHKPYRDYADFLSRHFDGKVQKLAVDAGFTCPNRDGSKGLGGCIYCNNSAFNTSYCNPQSSVTDQLEAGKHFFAGKYPKMQYLAYFQAHTNTYASLERLKVLYEEALAVDGVVGIVISTRPDCVSDELLTYLKELQRHAFVMLEYGIESLNDATLKLINRCHNSTISVEMIHKTATFGIPMCAHLILGLPGETVADMLSTVQQISQLPVDVVKFHQLQVIRGTRLAQMLEKGEFVLETCSAQQYVALVAHLLQHLSPEIAVERFVSESRGSMLVSPKWGIKPQEFNRKLFTHMQEHSIFQGQKFNFIGK